MDLITSIPPTVVRRNQRGDDVGFDYSRQCVGSWRRRGFRILSLNRDHEVAPVRRTFGLEPIPFTDPEDALFPGRFGPPFGEIAKNLKPDRPVCIVNADIYMLGTLDLTRRLEDLCQDAFLFAQRIEVPDLSAPFHSIYRKGVDLVAFRPDRIPRVINDTEFRQFKLGVMWWDYVLPIAASFCVPVRRIGGPLLLHHMHPSSLNNEIYDAMRLRAFEVLSRLAREASLASPAAREFHLRIKNLNLAAKQDRESFFQTCVDWLAGRIGPIDEVELELDIDQTTMTRMLRATLDELTAAREEVAKQERTVAKLKKDIAKLEGRRASKRRKRIPDGFSLKGQISLTERLAERWLALYYGWDLDVFRGYRPVTPNHSGAYRIRNAQPLLYEIRPKIEALHVGPWGRFGNSIRQVLNALYMAEALGVQTVCFTQPHSFLTGQHAGGLRLLWNADGVPCSRPCLVGSFFHLNAFNRKPTPSETARIFSELIRPLVRGEVREPDPRVRDDDLVLHFRSGDAFAGPEYPRNHGQPPLSYYLAAVERERPARVWLVFEDRGNPCIDAAEAALRQNGLEVIVQSGTVEDDLRVLLSAQRLVGGRGSFIPMTAHLSDRLQRLYVFHGGRRMKSLAELGIKVFLGKDIGGEYESALLNGNWAGLPAQRALMLSYPAEKLSFTALEERPQQPPWKALIQRAAVVFSTKVFGRDWRGSYD